MLVEVPRTDTDTVGMCRGKISSRLFFGFFLSSLYLKSVRKNLFAYCFVIFKYTINANCLHIVFTGNSLFLCLLAEARILLFWSKSKHLVGKNKKRLLIEIAVLPVEEKKVVL